MRSDLQKRWDTLVSKVDTRREQFDKFVEVLKDKSTYFTAPASPKYHCNWEEGLLEHSINVAENAIAIKNVLAPGIPDESCVICGLFHDLGKGPIGKPYYLFAEPTEKQAKAGYVPYPPFTYNDDRDDIYLSVPQRAVRQVTRFIPLRDYEYQAILIHDGQYVNDNDSYSSKENPFALILSYADNFAGFVQEGIDAKSESGKKYDRTYRYPKMFESMIRQKPWND